MAKRIQCGQCVAVMINGVFCHEHGCPNSPRPQRQRSTCTHTFADWAAWYTGKEYGPLQCPKIVGHVYA